MPSINKFEDLIAWQEARTLVKMIYKLTSDGVFSRDFGMRDQIQRASVSVMANIAEGFDCESTANLLVSLASLAARLWKSSPYCMLLWMWDISIKVCSAHVTNKPKSVKHWLVG